MIAGISPKGKQVKEVQVGAVRAIGKLEEEKRTPGFEVVSNTIKVRRHSIEVLTRGIF